MIELKEDSIIFSINNNDVYDLPFLWFRDNCQCDECRITETQEKQFLLNTVPLSIKPVKALETEDAFLITLEDCVYHKFPAENKIVLVSFYDDVLQLFAMNNKKI